MATLASRIAKKFDMVLRGLARETLKQPVNLQANRPALCKPTSLSTSQLISLITNYQHFVTTNQPVKQQDKHFNNQPTYKPTGQLTHQLSWPTTLSSPNQLVYQPVYQPSHSGTKPKPL